MIETDSATLVLVASTRTVSAPAVLPAVYVTVVWPLLSVTPLVSELNDAPLVFVENANITVSPGTRLPLASVTVAVSVAVPPALTVLVEVSSCTRAAGPAAKEMFICVRKPCTSAVTMATPAVVLAVRSTCAIPFVSVLTVRLLPLALDTASESVLIETLGNPYHR